MAAPVGSLVKLYFDTRRTLDVGDVCQSGATGRSYRIVTARRQTRGKHEGRWHIEAIVIDPATVTDDDHVFTYHWYRR
jgi:hypothetical protein